MHGHSKSAFTIELVNDKQTKDLLKARSALDDLREVVVHFKTNKKEEMQLILLTKAIKILSMLLCFIHDQEYSEHVDYAENHFTLDPIKHRQAIMRDLGVIDLLMDLVHFPFANSFYTIDEVDRPLYISKVVSLGYIVIKSIIKELRQNELYASQWLDLFAEYALKDVKNILKIKDTFTELIDNNEKILDVQITDQLVSRILTFFLNSPPDSKIVSIIRAMCSCNRKPVVKNQEMISNFLLTDKMTLGKILSSLKVNEQNQIVIVNPWDSSSETVIRLKELKDKSKLQDNGAYFEYYINLLALLSELCLGRNYFAINILKTYFPFSILTEILWDPQFDASLRTACTRLLGSLFVDVFPCQPLAIPHLVRDFAAPNLAAAYPELSAQTTQDHVHDFARLKTFLLALIQAPLDPADVPDCSELYIQAIALCQQMLRLGYFKAQQDLKMIYEGLIKIAATDWKPEVLEAKFKIKQKSEFFALSNKFASLSLKSKMDQVEYQGKVDKIKMSVCSILVDLLHVETDFQITKTTALYKNYIDGKESNSIYKQTLENQSLVLAEEENRILNEGINKKALFEMIDKQVLRADNLIEKESNLRNFLIENTLSENKELKDFSFQLLKKMYSGGQRLISYLEHLLVIDTDQGRQFFKRATDIQLHLFKLIEKLPAWFNREHSLRNEYNQLLDLLNKLDEDFKEAGRLNIGQLGFDASQMSNQLNYLSREHLFVKINLLKIFDGMSHFYQSILEKTGTLDCLIRLINLMVNFLINSEDQVKESLTEANKVILDSLILLICKTINGNSDNKLKLVTSLTNWLKIIPKLNNKGFHILSQNSKNVFSAKNIGSETSNKLLEGSYNRKQRAFIAPEYSAEGEVPIFTNLIQLVIETVRNSTDHLKDHQLVLSIVQGIIEVLKTSSYQSSNTYLMAQCLLVLEELVFDNQAPIRENQSLIIKLIAEHTKQGVLARYQNSSILTVLTRDINLPLLEERIENTSVSVFQGKLCLDMAFVSVIALCTYSKNEYTERLAQSILSSK
jgi:hypothetical protein